MAAGVLLGHLEEALSVDESGVVRTVNIDGSARAVHHDLKLLDAQVAAQVPDAVRHGPGSQAYRNRTAWGS